MHIRYYRPRRVLPVVVYVRLSVPGRMGTLCEGPTTSSTARDLSLRTAMPRYTCIAAIGLCMYCPSSCLSVCLSQPAAPLSSRLRRSARLAPSALGSSRASGARPTSRRLRRLYARAYGARLRSRLRRSTYFSAPAAPLSSRLRRSARLAPPALDLLLGACGASILPPTALDSARASGTRPTSPASSVQRLRSR